MKILIVSHEYPPIGGGGANACMFLANEFTRKENKVDILTAKYKEQPEVETVDNRLTIFRVKCLRKKVESSNFIEMFSFLASALHKADKLEKENRYDICLVFFGIPSGPIALHLKKKYNLPYVIRSGGGDIPGTQKRFKYVYKVLEPSLRRIWKEAAGIIANSQGLKERAEKFENRYQISVIENGVDMNFFSPSHQKKDSDTVKILFVSRLIERKGLQLIIPLLQNIQKKVWQQCNNNIELVIVGDGPYRSQLEELVDETKTRELVRFEGQKNKNELVKYYKEADIFLLPSMWEGMPNVVLEAMSSGLPIIMTPCEGSKELITDNGIIADYDNMEEKIVFLCTHKEERCQMGKNSVKNIEQKYQWNIISDRYLNFLCDRKRK